jgi:hypothetical protein
VHRRALRSDHHKEVSGKQTLPQASVHLLLRPLVPPRLLALVVDLVLPLLLLLDLVDLEPLLLHLPVVLEEDLELLHPPRLHLEVPALEPLPLLHPLVLLRPLLVDYLGLTLPQHQAACLARRRPQHRVASEAPLRPLEEAVSELPLHLLPSVVVPLLEPRLLPLQDCSGRTPRLHQVALADSVLRPPVPLEPRLPPRPVDFSEPPLHPLRRRDFLVPQRLVLLEHLARVRRFNPIK